MPLNVVKTPEDEKKWKKAEAVAASQGKAENYAYVMGIYKRMKPDHFKKAASQISHKRFAFNKYNAPELVSQLMAVLHKAGLDDAVNQLKMKKVPQLIDKAWRERVEGVRQRSFPRNLSNRAASMSQPLMLQPDYGAEDEHPCQHGGECQCGGACQGRVAARAKGARGGFLSQSKKVTAFRDLGWALAGRPDVAQKIERILEQHGLRDMAKVMRKAFSDLQADLDLMYMD